MKIMCVDFTATSQAIFQLLPYDHVITDELKLNKDLVRKGCCREALDCGIFLYATNYDII